MGVGLGLIDLGDVTSSFPVFRHARLTGSDEKEVDRSGTAY